ncbi:ectonucleotide pyrophosphatase/phosphodiesterase [Rhodanobacter sp. MP1X3]|uniref:alkaline phosphatase family protein n=1 Tax=Rhodanobacter sp. MP1X3 TaxID=2723086 RepID=UPI001616E74E|nr:ectonucleotide pyrophosphatase/phosphodiesterase [Rhodanobacter sp. MP1X3]MBB6240981.1 putative AlkP superfamily pyrophosphatase or phosphodiesterase [Rhodanobacter sp. MP1X3]
MRFLLYSLLLSTLSLAATQSLFAQSASTQSSVRQSVLLISIDGLRPADVLDAQQRGLHLPNLQAFLKQGSYAHDVRGVLPTLTYPSHTTLITGVSPNVHGIGSNLTFDPTNKNQQGWDWYASDIRVPTLWDAAHAAGLSTANVHWPVSVGAQVDWNLPQIWRTGLPDDRKLVAALSTPGLLPSLEKDLGPYADGIDESLAGDQNRTRFAIHLLETRKPQFMTAYVTALDTEQHATGPDTPTSRKTLEGIDALIGDLVAAARRVHPDGVIAIVSDHGFAPVKQDINFYAPFIKAGLVTVKNGTITDWQAAVWNDGGSAAIVLKDPNDAAVKTKVATLLKQLQDDPRYEIDHVLDHDQLVAQGGTGMASWFVLLKIGYELGVTPDAPLPAPGHFLGMHGYDPATSEMRSTFLIEGPGIPAGKNLGSIDMRDIAPTLAKLMGASLPQAQGHALPLLSPAH